MPTGSSTRLSTEAEKSGGGHRERRQGEGGDRVAMFGRSRNRVRRVEMLTRPLDPDSLPGQPKRADAGREGER